ncbi:spore germination protein KC [Anaerovirgula multivorans]|uniref:Spore germination protein KC n=1 Tax=Anaerovirgula multivorans TaxID=312168 RepID=A0A239EP32_9FIRM|nr:Ger(x)C family spore germination protein [Anaerovirgula multivorans]SNS45624.1 spore germination protein KC [Anaerovirgula multivorans]
MKKILLFIIIILQIITLPGCWNQREINDLVIALALGVDIIEDKQIQLTVQAVIPRKLGRDGVEGSAAVTYTETGKTIFEALRKVATVSSHKIYIGHIQLIVFGESVAMEGIQRTIDFLERDHEFRRQAVPIVSKGMSAKELLEIESIYEALPAVHIVNALKNNEHVGFSRNLILMDAFEEYNTIGHHLVLGTISKAEKENPQYIRDLHIQGTGVFGKDRLIGYLGPYETRGYLWIVGEVKGGILVVPPRGKPDELIGMEIINAESKMDVEIVDGQMVLKVHIKEEGNIGDQQNPKDHTDPAGLLHLQREKEKLIRMEVTRVFDIAQNDFQVDFFGFGELVYRKYPKLWKEIQEDWDEIFTNCPIEITVEAKVERTGQILAPSISD